MTDRGTDWVEQAARGDYRAIPAPLGFAASAGLAHRIDAYRLLGDFEPVARMAQEVRARGLPWRGNALELWVTLFFEHRASRHGGTGEEDAKNPELNALAEALRQRLVAADPQEREEILDAIRRAEEVRRREDKDREPVSR